MNCPSASTCPAAVALAVLVLLAGCPAVDVPDVDGRDDSTPTPEPVTVEVVEVVDGDTVDVAFPDGRRETVRLVGVDAPETRGEVSPDEFEGVPATDAGRECLRRWGERASAFATRRLADREVRLIRDPATDRRGDYGRLLAHVAVVGNDTTFGRHLLDGGYARVYVTDFARLDEFRAAEDAAQDAGRGVWGCAG